MNGRRAQTVVLVMMAMTLAAAGAAAQTVAVAYGDTVVQVPRVGTRVELFPVLRLIGAEAAYSAAAGTYGVTLGDHVIQFTTDRRSVLADGVLREAAEAPVASPGGVAASLAFLERELLGPLGFHLEAVGAGYRVERGGQSVEPVVVRPVAADFASTTTLVLTLGREAAADVTTRNGTVSVRFPGASPQIDHSVPFRSRRVRLLKSVDDTVEVTLDEGAGLLRWHLLGGPARVILELGSVQLAPTPAPLTALVAPVRAPIVIDPGHGGDDTGAVGGDGFMEKDLVLAIARLVARSLEAQGHVVRLTRDGDEARALTDRTALANRLEARAFVSLHANASTVASVRGAETYYMSLDTAATDASAAATANFENQVEEVAPGRSPLDLILWDLAQSEVLNESAQLALAIQGRLNAQLGLKDRGVKQAPFVVLTGATMPAALVEVGFLSNGSEASLLRDPDHQLRLAEAVTLGILDYVNRP